MALSQAIVIVGRNLNRMRMSNIENFALHSMLVEYHQYPLCDRVYIHRTQVVTKICIREVKTSIPEEHASVLVSGVLDHGV